MGLNDNFSKVRNIDLKDCFSAMSVNEITDYKFLSNFILNRCGIRLNAKFVNIDHIKMGQMKCQGGLQIKQYPEELAKFLVFIFNNKHRINSYCEIGSERGGTFFVVDSFLRSVNPQMGNSIAIDIHSSRARQWSYNQYSTKYPQASFLHIDSAVFSPSQNYDLCFIDANHKRDLVTKDFLLMKKVSKIIAFHDIYFCRGVRKVWNWVEGKKTEICNQDPMFQTPVGIGILDQEV